MSTNMIHSISNQIRSRILFSGPITVADYMKMALTQQTQSLIRNPTSQQAKITSPEKFQGDSGYYMGRDVFGQYGDFITSPEISQLFGEMIGVWGIDTWRRIGGPKTFNIVELGPGRGTLAKDVLRVFQKLKDERVTGLNLHLVEISPFLAKIQYETLCGPILNNSFQILDSLEYNEQNLDKIIDPAKNYSNFESYHQGVTKDAQVPISWHRDLASVPKGFNFYIAHEFFDALPLHKLQRIDNNWREILVDIKESEDRKRSVHRQSVGVLDLKRENTTTTTTTTTDKTNDDNEKFRFVLSRHETPVIKLLKSHYEFILKDEARFQIEFSLENAKICEELARRLEEDGGMVLLVDYGHEGTKEDTFRGFYRHKLHNPLENPGHADLTADVDFSIMKKIFQNKALICGPITQQEFLAGVGIDVRFSNLYQQCKKDEERKQLVSGYKMLMEDMGKRFKCLALFPKILEKFRPKLKITAFD